MTPSLTPSNSVLPLPPSLAPFIVPPLLSLEEPKTHPLTDSTTIANPPCTIFCKVIINGATGSERPDLLSFTSFFKGSVLSGPSRLDLGPSHSALSGLSEGGLTEPEPRPHKTWARLIEWLTVFFAEGRLCFGEELGVEELMVALVIFRRKFKSKDNSIPQTREELAAAIQLLLQTPERKAHKRTEEKNKFIFKHTIKMMKSSFLTSKSQNLTVNEAGKMLLSRYDLPPDTLNHGALSLMKLKQIFANKKFADDFLALIVEPTVEQSMFLRLYQSNIKKKIMKMMKKWGREAGDEKDLKKLNESIASYFLSNGQCKLPWTRNEVVQAIKCLVSSIESVSEDC